MTAISMKKKTDLAELKKAIANERNDEEIVIRVSGGTCGIASGATQLKEALETEILRQGLRGKAVVSFTGCQGFCEHEPLVTISPKEIFYERVKPEHAADIVRETILGNKTLDHLLHVDHTSGQKIRLLGDVPFYKKQQRELLENNRLIDPTRILDYVAVGGYEALVKALTEMTPEAVIEEIKKSGLRGRGGAGFATGIKWELCRGSEGSSKYVIANGDEGDPGAYMDRSVMEGNPHCVIEGMIIGAYAIGANDGFVYVRAEYPLAVENLALAIEKCRDYGLLGKNIFGSGFDFDLEINMGAGAFVCGEETALIASLEGRRGMPRTRPPYPALSGFAGCPTNINNVETWATIPLIIKRGARWFASIGTEKSKGTKIFSLVGKVNNTGLVEVPMGIKLSEIIYDIGGGIPNGKEFKAVQTGGPSGGCLPKELLDLPIDYESLAKAGSIMGSGGMIVMDEDNCMVDVAHYFLGFTKGESCGKCVPCRVGTGQMYEILGRIKEGRGVPEDIATLERLARTVKEASLCGLGQTVPNPVLTTLKYFRYEYEAHIHEKRCPALSCKTLITYVIVAEKCVGCNLCAKNCPSQAIVGVAKKPYRIIVEKCAKCGTCLELCPAKVGAVKKASPVPVLEALEV